MTLKAVLDADGVSELDEAVRSLYTEGEDGNYVLDVDGVDDLPQVRKLAHAFRETKSDRQKTKRQLDRARSRFGPLFDADDDELDFSNVDPERLSEFMPYLRGEKDIPTGEGGKDLTDEQREKIRVNEAKRYQPKIEAAESDRDRWRSVAHNEIISNRLSKEFARAGVKDPDYLDLLIDRYRRKCELHIDDDGRPNLVVKDTEYGDVSPSEFIKEWKGTDYAKKFIDGGGSTGGGAGGSGNGSQRVKNPWDKAGGTWNMEEQKRIYNEDPERARRMAAAVGKTIR